MNLTTNIRPAGSGYGHTLDILVDAQIVQQITSWDRANLEVTAERVTAAAVGRDLGATYAERSNAVSALVAVAYEGAGAR